MAESHCRMRGIDSTGNSMPESITVGSSNTIAETSRATNCVCATLEMNNTNALCHIRHGESILHEFELLHDAGLSNLEILQGVTTEAARIFGLTDRGTIEVGKRADLVLVEGDPTQNISACQNIKQVWVKGIKAT